MQSFVDNQTQYACFWNLVQFFSNSLADTGMSNKFRSFEAVQLTPCALFLWIFTQPVYGFASGDPLRFKRAVGHKDLFYIDDREVDFKEVRTILMNESNKFILTLF